MRVVSLMVSSPHTEVRPITRDQGTHERAAEYRSWGRREEGQGHTKHIHEQQGIEKLQIGSLDKLFLALAIAVM